jgi:hypothetical protein
LILPRTGRLLSTDQVHDPTAKLSARSTASADLHVAKAANVEHTGLPAFEFPPPMERTPSKPMAALWMAGWLALMLMITVAGREALYELNVSSR